LTFVYGLALLGILLVGCVAPNSTTGSGDAVVVDRCQMAEVGGIAGFHGTFTMGGRPATAQEIADRTVSGGDYADAMSYVHVKSRTNDPQGTGYNAELDPNCPYAAANRAKDGR